MKHPSSQHGISRDAFLARIRAAIGQESPTEGAPPPPAVDESIVRLATPDQDLVSLFARRAGEVGMMVRETSMGSLSADLRECLSDLGASSASLSFAHETLRRTTCDILNDTAVSITGDNNEARFEDLYETDVGISDVERAIAETGTLVYASGEHRSRGGFLVPPTHIAIVRASQIVADMIDHWPSVSQTAATPGALPSSMVMITGPSKTADIEGILITGVHGPGAVHVFVVGDE